MAGGVRRYERVPCNEKVKCRVGETGEYGQLSAGAEVVFTDPARVSPF
jgi:hypothetical protein